jgi:hypothetical protein
MRWLADGVPITLLCDLATSREPESQTINLTERPPYDVSDPLSARALAAPDDSLASAG